MAPLAVCPLAEYCRYPRHQLGPGRHPALVVFVFLLPAEVASSEAAAQLRELSEGSSLNNKQIFSVVQDNETFRQSYLLVIPTPDGDVPILGAKGLKVKFNKYFHQICKYFCHKYLVRHDAGVRGAPPAGHHACVEPVAGQVGHGRHLTVSVVMA